MGKVFNSNNIELMPLELLTFDLENPRLPNSLGREVSDILDWMLSKENVTDLMLSIGEKGFFPGEPVLVVPHNSIPNKFVVIEGNRRYTAVLLLLHPELAPQKKQTVSDISKNASNIPTEIPTLVFKGRIDIIDYLGYRHITGVEPWDALAKARYLRQLGSNISSSDFREKCKTLARQIGSKAPYVRQLLLGIELYDLIETNDFFGISGLDDRNFDFGTFYTGIVKPNVSRHLNLNIDSEYPTENISIDALKEITNWLFKKNDEGQTRVGESRNLGKLDKILDPKYPKALEAFREGYSLSVASELTDETDKIVLDSIRRSEENIVLAWKYFPLIKDYSLLKKDDLKKISYYLKQMYETLEKKQMENQDDIFL